MLTLDGLKKYLEELNQEKENLLVSVGRAIGKIEIVQELIQQEGEQSPSSVLTQEEFEDKLGGKVEYIRPIEGK